MKNDSKSWILCIAGCISIFFLFKLLNSNMAISKEYFYSASIINETVESPNELAKEAALRQRTMKIRQICETRGYSEDDTPIHEDTELSSLYHFKKLNLFLCM